MYITYIYMHLYVLSQWLVVLKKGVHMCCPLYVQFFHCYLISSEYIHCCERYCMLLHELAVHVIHTNRLPSQLSNTDCVLQEFVKSRKIHIGALAFGAARRGLNESFHFEFVMQNYSNPNYTIDSQSDFSVLPQSYNETTMQVEAPK